MRAIQRINHNAAICEDGAGRQLIALGRGIGFGDMPHEVDLDGGHADLTLVGNLAGGHQAFDGIEAHARGALTRNNVKIDLVRHVAKTDTTTQRDKLAPRTKIGRAHV